MRAGVTWVNVNIAGWAAECDCSHIAGTPALFSPCLSRDKVPRQGNP